MAECKFIYRKNSASIIPEWFDPKNDSVQKGGMLICSTGETSIIMKDVPEHSSAERFAQAVEALPVSMKATFTDSRGFVVLGAANFNSRFGDVRMPSSAKIGIVHQDGEWFVRSDILTAKYEKSMNARIWFAVISFVSEALSEENGFERAVFERAFLRRLKNDPNIKDDELVYERFIDSMLNEKRFDRKELAERFRYLRRPEAKEGTFVQPNYLPGSTEAMLVRDMYRQFADRGIRIRKGGDEIAFGLKSVSSTERPKGTHRVNLHYISGAINGWLDSAAGAVLPEGNNIKVSFAPGLTGLYEKRRAVGGKEMMMVAGSFLDVRFAETWFGRSGGVLWCKAGSQRGVGTGGSV